MGMSTIYGPNKTVKQIVPEGSVAGVSLKMSTCQDVANLVQGLRTRHLL